MTTTFTITRDGREIPLTVIYSVANNYLTKSGKKVPEMIVLHSRDAQCNEWALTPDELDKLYEQEKRLAKQGEF